MAAGYLGCAVAVLPAPPRPRDEAARAGSVLAGVVGFLAMVRRDPTLSSLMALTAAAEMFGFSHQAVLPSLARDVLHVGRGASGC